MVGETRGPGGAVGESVVDREGGGGQWRLVEWSLVYVFFYECYYARVIVRVYELSLDAVVELLQREACDVRHEA